jgi:alkyl hydroperoxide reductase subunit F
MHDLVIIGGGPAGIAAAVYAARKRLSSIVIAEEVGGQSKVSEGIENWIGTPIISGADLARSLHNHLEAVKGDVVTLALGERAVSLKKKDGVFSVATQSGRKFTARAVLVASGASRRKLTIPDADTFEHKGLTYCASCDGPLFAGSDVAVIGGGNAGFETALQLLAYAKSVTLINRGTEIKADPITVEKARAHPHMRIITNVDPIRVVGDRFVAGLIYANKASGETTTLAVSGIFVEIGVLPNTDFAAELLELDEVRRVKTDPRSQRTSVEGVWAAGDCTDELYHQNNIAAGDGVKALEDIYLWLKRR